MSSLIEFRAYLQEFLYLVVMLIYSIKLAKSVRNTRSLEYPLLMLPLPPQADPVVAVELSSISS